MAGVASLLFMSSKKTGQNPDRGTGLQPKNCDPIWGAMAQTAIIVPCRLESTRFPRKLLHNIRGKPLLLWVAERISTQAPEFPLWFAVDDELLRQCVVGAGFKAILTSPTHPSGTDRLAEANRTVKAKFVINVQADEPLVSGAQLRELARLITSGKAAMATLATPFKRIVDFYNPNQVKLVVRADGRALYFSRSRLPFSRDLGLTIDDAWVESNPCLKHLGLYAYRADLLEKFSALPPGRYEQIERLEQLRVLENGEDILVGITNDPSIGVDTPEDAGRFEQMLETGSNK
jgi:3-deoxy-manno-octulosonate cytidylyltransferase (CMP-KDO synthetase)